MSATWCALETRSSLDPERTELLRITCTDELLLATVDLYTRSGCAMDLRPLYRIRGTKVVRAWALVVDLPTSPPMLEGPAAPKPA